MDVSICSHFKYGYNYEEILWVGSEIVCIWDKNIFPSFSILPLAPFQQIQQSGHDRNIQNSDFQQIYIIGVVVYEWLCVTFPLKITF